MYSNIYVHLIISNLFSWDKEQTSEWRKASLICKPLSSYWLPCRQKSKLYCIYGTYLPIKLLLINKPLTIRINIYIYIYIYIYIRTYISLAHLHDMHIIKSIGLACGVKGTIGMWVWKPCNRTYISLPVKSLLCIRL